MSILLNFLSKITLNSNSSISISKSIPTSSFFTVSGSLPTGYALTGDGRGIIRNTLGSYSGPIVVLNEKINAGESVSVQRSICSYYSVLGLSSYNPGINVDDTPYSLSQGNDGSNSYIRRREYGISYSGSCQEYGICDYGDWFRIRYENNYVTYERSDDGITYTTICQSTVVPSGSYFVWLTLDDTSNTGFLQIKKNFHY